MKTDEILPSSSPGMRFHHIPDSLCPILQERNIRVKVAEVYKQLKKPEIQNTGSY